MVSSHNDPERRRPHLAISSSDDERRERLDLVRSRVRSAERPGRPPEPSQILFDGSNCVR
jgi:hypothetical protein